MIRLDKVHKKYGEQTVLDDVSLNINAGSITAVIGKSGGGKSVLIRHMIGLEQPDSGAIYIEEKDIVKMKATELNTIRRRFGVLFQDAALFDSLSVEDNVAFPVREHLKLSEGEIADRVDAKLAEVGMNQHKHKFPGELSGGMKKRVGLARALALDPDIVFFDEPTSGLDPITKGLIYRLIADTHKRHLSTYVLVSHDIRGVLQISDEVMMLLNGKISPMGTPEDVLNATDPAVKQFITGSTEGPIPVE